LFAHGTPVDWTAFFAGTGARTVDLPTYPFQNQHYWLNAPRTARAADLGLEPAGHPLLGTATALPDSAGALLTGRLSLRTHPWLADHAVLGTVLVPGTALVELALKAGELVGADALEELTLAAPLVIPQQDGVDVHVSVGPADDSGRRTVTVHSRTEGDHADEPWTRHATGFLADAAENEAEYDGAGLAEAWPPAGAEPVDVEALYESFAEAGYAYGPAFRGLAAAWRRGDEVFTETLLPEDPRTGTAGFGLHPALFDAALHGTFLQGGGERRLPFTWAGARWYATGATELRTRLTPTGPDGGIKVTAFDGAGKPVASVDSLVLRPVPAGELGGAPADPLYRVEWVPVTGAEPAKAVVLGSDHEDLTALRAAVAAGAPLPEVVLCPVGGTGTPGAEVSADEVRAASLRGLALVQEWLSDEALTGSRLVLVTTRAVAVDADEDVHDLAHAPLWGLVRSALVEHPGRFGLADVDRPEDLEPLAAALGGDEPQLAVRDGAVRAARLTRAAAPAPQDAAPGFGGGTVLVTGGTGTLGALVARHLVTAHGVERLLLTSRRGPAAEGAAELVAELSGLGAQVRVEACDVADRDAVRDLLESVPAAHPLTAVVHTAGVIDDGVVGSLTGEQLESVFRAKADSALHLHELTRDLGLADFVLFSGAAGVFGSAGQAHYAAANVFLDALAQRRRARGLPATAMAWGLWAERSGMTSQLDRTALHRLSRAGFAPIPSEQGLALFDAARAADAATLVTLQLDKKALRAQADAGTLPPFLSTVVPAAPAAVRTAATRTAAAAAPDGGPASLAERLSALAEPEQNAELVALVSGQVADVLGHASAAAVDPAQAFKDLGFDSLSSVELRNRLNQATGLRLAPTLVFDHPSPEAVARQLREELLRAHRPSADRVLGDLARLDGLLGSAEAGDPDRDRIVRRLEELVARFGDGRPTPPATAADQGSASSRDVLEDISDDELFDFIDNEL
ncbi:type I polyketide synthase, partial [Streptomyces polychromogenes]